MKCVFCGEEFETNKRGRKREYCMKEECVKQAHREASSKYYKKIMDEKKETSEEPLAVPEKISYLEEEKIIYSKEDKLEIELKYPDISDITQLAREYGAVRLSLIQIAEKCREEHSKCDKQEQDLLHQLENLEEMSSKKAVEIAIELKKNREKRRVYKNREYLVQALLGSMLMKNPPQFVAKAVQRAQNFQYLPRTLKELKQDETLYMKTNDDGAESKNNG